MSIGSGLWSRAKAAVAHLVKPGGGLSGEIYDLRKDIGETLSPIAAITVEEWTNPVGTASPGAAVLKAATTVSEDPVTLVPADLLAAGLAMLAAWPRTLIFTTAGGTAGDVPADVVITGKDHLGADATETLALNQSAGTAVSVNYYSEITSIAYPAGDGTDATVAIGISAAVIKPATTTSASAVTLGPDDLIQDNLGYARQIVFSTGTGTPAHAPDTVTITGTDAQDKVLEETLNVAQTNTTATSVNAFKTIKSIAFPAGGGTGTTVAISFAAPLGLSRKIKNRSGASYFRIWNEAVNGANATNGTVSGPATIGPYGGYTPNSAANDASDYALAYEYDASV